MPQVGQWNGGLYESEFYEGKTNISIGFKYVFANGFIHAGKFII